MFRLSHLSALEFTGADAGQFLQNQLSADIMAIQAGTAGFACVCNPSGRVLGLLLIGPSPEGYLAVCAAELAGELTSHLTRYVLRSAVSIQDRGDLQVVGGADPAGTADGTRLLAVANGPVYGLLESHSAAPGDENRAARWKARELASGIVWLNQASSGRFLPQMLGAEGLGALSFKKGCYPGQEVIARTRYLGKLKRHPLLASIDAHLEPERMGEAGLRTPDGEIKSVVVDCAHPGAADTLLFLVARTSEAPASALVEFDGLAFEARLDVPAEGFQGTQGWATT
jgi:folate-binding protein YgfZ